MLRWLELIVLSSLLNMRLLEEVNFQIFLFSVTFSNIYLNTLYIVIIIFFFKLIGLMYIHSILLT